MAKKKNEEHLQSLVRRELHMINPAQLPRLSKFIETDTGFERAEDIIYNIAAREGISIQAAMASLDSDIGSDNEYTI